MSETKRLGRGLEALLGPMTREQAEASGALRELPVASVRPNPFQPRTRMDEGPLDELVASIAGVGAAAADRRAAPGRRLRADRRRAPLARGDTARLDEDSRGREGRRRPDAAHARPDREPAA